eukprot:TRINITY_DN590_c0_g1_i3.p1 TRINITY_DN590_c0_g1~~TRINITY_DN590_c0_g1_i3.p1  ORF type:complete len:119 (+),score=10.83 TRINITY_DN590_c0_g1_i3:219-575(+)
MAKRQDNTRTILADRMRPRVQMNGYMCHLGHSCELRAYATKFQSRVVIDSVFEVSAEQVDGSWKALLFCEFTVAVTDGELVVVRNRLRYKEEKRKPEGREAKTACAKVSRVAWLSVDD